MSTIQAGDGDCAAVRAALMRGGADADWAHVERHLTTCADCAAGLARFTTAVEEQFAASRSLGAQQVGGVAGSVDAPPEPLRLPIGRPAAAHERSVPIWRHPRLIGAAGALAAALLVLAVVLAVRTSSGSGSVSADRRPEFVPSLQVLPARPNNTYYAGEQVQVCLRINQPSRVHLSVLEGRTTFDLYDAETDPGSHCFPERITGGLTARATLRIEVFFGTERVAREDVVLLPASATPGP